MNDIKGQILHLEFDGKPVIYFVWPKLYQTLLLECLDPLELECKLSTISGAFSGLQLDTDFYNL